MAESAEGVIGWQTGGGMIKSWRILVADGETAAEQMAIDERLACEARPTLRLFRWRRPAISLGFRQTPPQWAEASILANHGVELVERPTGGGLAVHGSDLSCSVTILAEPSLTLRDLIRTVCEGLAKAVGSWGISVEWLCDIQRPVCLPRGTPCPPRVLRGRRGRRQARIEYCLIEESPYALMIGTRKLCGFAVRRYPESWLIQGSMLVRPLPAVFRQVMPLELFRAFCTRAISLEETLRRALSDEELMARLIKAWRTTWDVPCFWSRSDRERVHRPQSIVHSQTKEFVDGLLTRDCCFDAV